MARFLVAVPLEQATIALARRLPAAARERAMLCGYVVRRRHHRGGPVIAFVLALPALGGCYHFAFQQEPATNRPTVTYTEHPATFVNGFIGTGVVYAGSYCPHPVRTELHVSAGDVLIAMATLLVYTPHTLEVVCPAPETQPPTGR
jgi:hypothetical protein